MAALGRLSALEPELAIMGHGPALHGPALRDALRELAGNFDKLAVPHHGTYAEHPARAEDGSAYRKA